VHALETSPNPFAAVVLAHTQALATRGDPPTRLQWKLRVAKGLYQRGWGADDIRELFRLVDWIMDLPDNLEDAFCVGMFQFDEEKRMRYVTSIERFVRKRDREEGRCEGLQEGIALLLDLKFGERGLKLMSKVRSVQDLAALRALADVLKTAMTLDEVREHLPRVPRPRNGRH
jgi:hypothetical protein